MSDPIWRDVVVVDDNMQFVLHVWRFLGRVVGFRVGDVYRKKGEERADGDPSPGDDLTMPIRPAEALKTAYGRYRIWWVDAADRWEDPLDRVAAAVRPGDRSPGSKAPVALVDVQPRPKSVTYDCDGVCRALARRGFEPGDADTESRILVVSAYDRETPGGRDGRVWPKSPLLLAHLRQLFEGRPTRESPTDRRKSPAADDVQHILVTGAGFEVRDSPFEPGLRPTAHLIAAMSETLRQLEDSTTLTFPRFEPVEPEQERFPLLSPMPSESPSALARLEDHARNRDLDRYMDAILEHLPDLPEKAPVDDTRWRDRAREHAFREAFRQCVVADDWGQLGHALSAARPNWVAWLTTNYTGFADRAVNLLLDHGREPVDDAERAPVWRIAGSASQADVLLHEELDARHSGGAAGNGRQPFGSRLLVKLHGDVADLHSMAIAGHDKAALSPLRVPVDALHKLYTAAEQFLCRHPKLAEGELVWHVVGHGLWDRLLTDLIGSVCRYLDRPGIRTRFVVVDREPAGPGGRLRDALDAKKVMHPEERQMLVKGKAARYLAHLDDAGLPSDPSALPGWWADLESACDEG